MGELLIRVSGTPVAQGSKKGFVRAGRVVMVEMAKGLPAWRASVTAAALNAMRAVGWVALTGAVEVQIVVFLARPRTVTRCWPAVPPDVDKIARGCLDALTDAGVWRSDAQAVRVSIEKRYADAVSPPGARIRVAALADRPVLA